MMRTLSQTRTVKIKTSNSQWAILPSVYRVEICDETITICGYNSFTQTEWLELISDFYLLTPSVIPGDSAFEVSVDSESGVAFRGLMLLTQVGLNSKPNCVQVYKLTFQAPTSNS